MSEWVGACECEIQSQPHQTTSQPRILVQKNCFVQFLPITPHTLFQKNIFTRVFFESSPASSNHTLQQPVQLREMLIFAAKNSKTTDIFSNVKYLNVTIVISIEYLVNSSTEKRF